VKEKSARSGSWRNLGISKNEGGLVSTSKKDLERFEVILGGGRFF